MNGTDIYREWAPPPGWRAVVACLWEQQVATDRDHRVVPDGCADIIVGPRGAAAVGLADGPTFHRLSAGSWCRGLRLRAEAVSTFFRVPAGELRNVDVALDDVVGTRRARALADTVLDGAPDPALELAPPERVQCAVRLLASMPVDGAADELGMSSRQLRRLVLAHTGVGPKMYQRVVRMRRFLDDPVARPLAEAAVLAGYADQAHLTREVTALCGLPPAALRAERR